MKIPRGSVEMDGMKKLENELETYQIALGIEEPWYVSYRELDSKEGLLHIGLNFKRGAEWDCPNCGKARKVYDIVNEDRTWRRLNFWQYKTLLHVRYHE